MVTEGGKISFGDQLYQFRVKVRNFKDLYHCQKGMMSIKCWAELSYLMWMLPEEMFIPCGSFVLFYVGRELLIMFRI